MLRRQVGARHEALVKYAIGREGHPPRPRMFAPSLAAARGLVGQAPEHVARQQGLDGVARWRRQHQPRPPDRFDLLIMAVETRRIDAPAQPAATADLILLGADE